MPVLVVSLIQWAKEGWTVLYYLFGLSGIGFFIKRHYFLWFISAITATYLLFPLYWRFFSRSRAKPRFTALFAAVWYLCSIPLTGVLKPIVFLFINRVPSFVLGVLLGWQQRERRAEAEPPRGQYRRGRFRCSGAYPRRAVYLRRDCVFPAALQQHLSRRAYRFRLHRSACRAGRAA